MPRLFGQPAKDYERLKLAVDAWKYVVSVQMHFNDMGMKVRNLFYTILAAAIGAVGFVQGRLVSIPYLGLELSLAMLVVFAVAPIAALFYFIDRHWYHRLLQASVKQGAAIEALYKSELPEIQLGQKISEASPLVLSKRWRYIFFFVKEKNFREHLRLHSDAKIEILYKSVMWGVLFVGSFHALFKGVQFNRHPLIFWLVEGGGLLGRYVGSLICH